MRELNQIASQKEYRVKKGLETGALRETKGNTHWDLHATIEMMEMFSKRLDDLLKATYTGTIQSVYENGAQLTAISSQLKTTEYNLNNAVASSGNAMIKTVKAEEAKLAKIRDEILKVSKNLKESEANTRTDIKKGTKLLRDFTAQQLEDMRNNIQEGNELLMNIHENMGGITQSLEMTLGNLEEKTEAIDLALSANHKDMVIELQQALGGLFKQSEENFRAMEENNAKFREGQARQMDKLNEQMAEQMDQFQSNLKKTMEKENADIRSTLANVRADIEMLKAVVTKLG